MKKLLISLTAALLALSLNFVSCGGGDKSVPVRGVSLNKAALTLEVGKSETLTAAVQPSNATNQAVTWQSSNASVATVTNGTVTANATSTGTATITATTQDGNKTASCAVTVTAPVTGVTLNKTATSISVGASETLVATIAPSNATNKNVTWSSNNTSIATVNDGAVTGIGVGAATITVTSQDGNKTASCAVTVVIPVAGVTLNKSNTTLTVNDTETLVATVQPSNATNQAVTWSSSNVGVATVNSTIGLVTAVAAGTATIAATAQDGGWRATCVVTVVPTVYVAGYENIGNQLQSSRASIATLWINGKAVRLSNGQQNAQASSVFVSNSGTAYVAGYGNNDNGIEVAKLWIVSNSTLQKSIDLSDGKLRSYANSVHGSNDGDVYMAGYEISGDRYESINGVRSITKAKLWKISNNALTEIIDLSDGTGSEYAYSVFVYGHDVYVAGNVYSERLGRYRIPRLWKNGTGQNLDLVELDANFYDASASNQVFVSEGDVYVTGKCSTVSGTPYFWSTWIWKNGDIVPASIRHYYRIGVVIPQETFPSLYVLGNDIYQAGIETLRANDW